MTRSCILSFAIFLGLVVPGSKLVCAQEKTRIESNLSAEYHREIRPLLSKYCFSCHGTKKVKGALNLESFQAAEVLAKARTWAKVWDRLRTHQMPPPEVDKVQPQPSSAERQRLIAWLEEVFAQATLDGQADPGPLSPRRLNVRETMNSLRDVVVIRSSQPRRLTFATRADGHVRLTLPPPHVCGFAEQILPQDTNDGGFDTIGENLSLPPFLMERYLRCGKIVYDETWSVNAKGGGDFAGPWHLRVKLDRIKKGPPPKNKTLRDEVAAYVREFAGHAFRRPVTAEEVEKYVKLYDLAQKKGEDFETSLRLPIQAILASPRFVLLWAEPQQSKVKGPVRPLDDYELASRLSYFIWSSTPDQELLKIAAKGGLNDPAVIEQQTRRMLKDRKVSSGLVEGFVLQWLQLDKLERGAPDAEKYPIYFKDNLGEVMKRELLLFVDALTFEDRSILEFVDADWGFLCQPLAQHYGIAGFPWKKAPGSEGPWQRWKFPDKKRGGVLTMGIVLTGTSQPLRTSPVARGKWVLETIFGTPPPPPPPDVDNVLPEEKVNNNLTVRQRMEKHRTSAACASCHRLIDPLGMALETFDPIGRWRDKDQNQPIDASGELVDGTKFKGIEDLKTVILSRKDDFTRAFVQHMLTYALGRKLNYYDVQTVREITNQVAQDEYKFSRVVVEIAKSYPFRHRRVQEQP